MIIIIDGYNLMHASSYFGEFQELEKNRTRMIQDLAQYKKTQSHKILLVFDAYKAGDRHETAEGFGGVNIIYTRLGETADEKIIKLAEEYREQAFIITNDKKIIQDSEIHGATSLSSEKFEARVLQSIMQEQIGFFDDEEDTPTTLSTKKKGNPRKLSKKERQKRKKLKKL
jgi:uncharacterized protein